MPTRSLTLEQILVQLPETPLRLATYAEGITPAQLQMITAPGEWSANEILAHLRACADVWGNNIVRILTEDSPAWQAVNPRSWIERTDYVNLQFVPSLRAFTKQRADLITALGPLAPRDWSRGAMVSGGGPTYKRTILYYAERLARHERAHVNQIGRIVRTLQV
jgi:hypothetical protein